MKTKQDYLELISELDSIERATGLNLTDQTRDIENASVPQDHEEFYDRCYESACSAAAESAHANGFDINKLIGRIIF